MANPIAESILALFSGGAQGYVGAQNREQARQDELDRYLSGLAERRKERAQAGQEAAAQRALTVSEAEKTRKQSGEQFQAGQELRGKQLTEEERHNKAVEENALDLKTQRLNYEQTVSGLMGQILDLKRQHAGDPKTADDLINTLYLKTAFDLASSPDISKKDLPERLKLLKGLTDAAKSMGATTANAPGAVPPGLPAGQEFLGPPAPPPIAESNFTTRPAPWLQHLIDTILQANISPEKSIKGYAKKRQKEILKTIE